MNQQAKSSQLYQACLNGEMDGKKLKKIERIFFLNQLGEEKAIISQITGSPVSWINGVLKAMQKEPERLESINKRFPDYQTKF